MIVISRAKCPKCGYKWNFARSKKETITKCPICGKESPIIKNHMEVENLKKTRG